MSVKPLNRESTVALLRSMGVRDSIYSMDDPMLEDCYILEELYGPILYT